MKYDLCAVSNHYGSLAFGHYTAYCRNVETGKWYDFNDSSVNEIDDPQEVVTSAAYVLYYIRKDFYPDGKVNYGEIKQTIEETVNDQNEAPEEQKKEEDSEWIKI